MSNEKTRTAKGDTMDATKDLHALVSDLLGEKDIKAFFEKAAARANVKVEKSKKEMTAKEQEEFEHACLRKEVFELLREFTVDAAQPRIMSWRWVRGATAQAVVNAVVLAGTVAAAGAITRTRGVSVDTTTEGDGTTETTTNTLWAANPRPSRRNSRVDAAV